ncbi:MAG: hypothetical protein V1875_08000 [Candidatus Altiarchaeota archaeon]
MTSSPHADSSWKSVHTYKGGLRGRIEPHLPELDRLVSGALGYAALGSLVVLVALLYFAGSSLSVQLITMAVGVFGGLIGVYFLNRSFDQEKNLQFFEGEKIILESKTPGTYAVVAKLSDRDIPFEPIRSNIYLTNLGILAERQGTGEAALFIPLDMITDVSPSREGIRVGAVDPRNQNMEVVLYLENRDAWLREISGQIDRLARINR